MTDNSRFLHQLDWTVDFDALHRIAHIQLYVLPYRPIRSVRASDDIILDIDAHNRLVGIELLNAWKCLYCGHINQEPDEKCYNCRSPHHVSAAPSPYPPRPHLGTHPITETTCDGEQCWCHSENPMSPFHIQHVQEIDKLKNALRSLYATPLENYEKRDTWGIKSIEDHNAIIREALGETEEEIFKKLEDAAAGKLNDGYKSELKDAGI